MTPAEIGEKYNRIASIYQRELRESEYGLTAIKRAIAYAGRSGSALDVGCGAGGRIIALLEASGCAVTGVDVSGSMIALAGRSHPDAEFHVADICTWQTDRVFDLVIAWDSLFHLPFDMHKPVLGKLAGLLAESGVFVYTLGNAVGEHTDQWHNDTFYYSSIGIAENLKVLMSEGLSVMHVELDQYPERHCFVIAGKNGS